jgi:hypothetical protein
VVSTITWTLPSRETATEKNWRRVFSKAIQTSPMRDRKMRMVNPNPRAPNIFIMVARRGSLSMVRQTPMGQNPKFPLPREISFGVNKCDLNEISKEGSPDFFQ